MAYEDYLKVRRDAAEALASKPKEDEAAASECRKDIADKARMIKELLADPRYVMFQSMIQSAREAFMAQLVLFDCSKDAEGVPVGDASSTLIRLGRLQGYVELCHLILTMPDTLLALGDQGTSPAGNGRHSNPHAARQDAS